MKSPLNYLGEKSRLAERIAGMLPKDHVCYCEPFCGAAWILFRKNPSKSEVINDQDGELVTFWRVVQNHLEEFLRYYKFVIISRKVFELENKKRPETLTDVQRAVRYFYLQKNGFGGKTHGRTFEISVTSGPRLNLSNIEEKLLEVHWRLSNVIIEHLDACECIARYDRPETLFYLDPPYYGTPGYAVPFEHNDYVRVRLALDKIKGRFLLSLNDCKEVRQIFKGFSIKKISTTYSAANGLSDNANRSEPRHELLIKNF